MQYALLFYYYYFLHLSPVTWEVTYFQINLTLESLNHENLTLNLQVARFFSLQVEPGAIIL